MPPCSGQCAARIFWELYPQCVKVLLTVCRNISMHTLHVQVQELHDDVEYYIDNNQEADYEENPYIYDVLPVDLQVCCEAGRGA